MQTILTNGIIYTGTEVVSGKALLIDGERIGGIIDPSVIPADLPVLDCRGGNISPGLIDLQIAGAGGYLFSAVTTHEALDAISRGILNTGTTGFLIALPTNSPEVYRKAFRVMKSNPHPAVLGLHLEGPYISHVKRGAHINEFIRRPSKNEVAALLEEAEGSIKMMTLAPEVCDSEIIQILNENDVIVAAGHSNATFSQALEGFDSGIRTVTHLFNAMSSVHHRDPGLPGAVFSSDTACASIIADGIHVDFNMLSISKKIMKERLFLVSDAVEENFVGAYQHVRKKDRFTLPEGTLSGSNLTMLEAVKNCVIHAGIPIDEALRMASAYPAGLIGAKDRGRICTGTRADLVIFNNNFEISGLCFNGDFY